MQLGVNNLPRVVTQQSPAGDRTRDLLIASPTPYRCATTPPGFVLYLQNVDSGGVEEQCIHSVK